MRKLKRQIEHIDDFLEALDEMMDARDDMWEEEKYCNYRHAREIKETKYNPAREKARRYLHMVVSDMLNREK